MSQNNEQILRGIMRAPLTVPPSVSNPWGGRTVLASGDATVTVATAQAKADSIVLFNTQAHVDQASGSIVRNIEVKSINPGTNITFGTADGIAEIRDVTIMWMLIKTS